MSGFDLRLPKAIGHRGCAQRAPENTLAGFRKAKALGCAWVEFDVRLSLDGQAVVFHDDTLERTTNGRGPVAAMMLRDLKALDAGSHFDPAYRGEPVPALDETLALLRLLGLGCDIELKAEPGREQALAEALARILAQLWPATLRPPLVTSFSQVALLACARAAPAIPRGYLTSTLSADWRVAAERVGAVAVICDHKSLNEGDIRDVKRAGLPLIAYTVNHSARAEALFASGVDAVVSDAPDGIL